MDESIYDALANDDARQAREYELQRPQNLPLSDELPTVEPPRGNSPHSATPRTPNFSSRRAGGRSPNTAPSGNSTLNSPLNLPLNFAPFTKGRLSARALAEWRWANVDNLDLFLRQVYDYYVAKGFYCIVLSWAITMGTILFVVVFSSFLYSCVDYKLLKIASQHTRWSDVRIDHCLARTSWRHFLFLWLFGLVWTLKLFHYLGEVRTLWEIHDFYHHLLRISEDEIQTISWQQVVERMVALRATNGASFRRLDAHMIVNRIMRQENYMIAMYNRPILDLEVNLPLLGGPKYEFLTKILEWSIALCLDDYVFNARGHIRGPVLREDMRDKLAAGLRRRFQFAALMNVVLAPLALFYMTLYYFFRYFNDFYTKPKDLGARQYTPLAELRFRELNELLHLFRRRLSMSDLPAQRYVSLFPRIKTELVVKFVIFVLSSFAAVLVAMSLYNADVLTMEIRPEQSVLVYLTTLGFLIAICRAMLSTPQEQAIYQSEAFMRQIVEFTHYMPDSWEGKLHTEPVKNEFQTLYDLKPKIILRELLSVFLNPVILAYKLAGRSERIIDFFRDHSVHVEELGGYVCSLAVFDSDRVNRMKARSDELDRYYMTQDGKMLKSYLNFMDVYGAPQSRKLASMYQSHYEQPASRESSRGDMVARDANRSDGNGRGDGHGRLDLHRSDLYRSDLPSRSDLVNRSDFARDFGREEDVPPLPMEASVMEQFDRLRHLPTVSEEPHTQSTMDGGLFSEDDEEDESIADDGVLGLLNNLYKR